MKKIYFLLVISLTVSSIFAQEIKESLKKQFLQIC